MKITERQQPEGKLASHQLVSDPVLNRIYQTRGVISELDIQYSLASIIPFQSMRGLDEASELLYNCFLGQKKIIVIGDYDVDGATATTVMVAGLREMGLKNVDFIIPNRITDGYGLTPKLVDRAHEKGADLLITVDNGIVSYSGVDHAKTLGMQVLVTDHHLAGETLPDCVIVNPNQPDCTFSSKSIAGVGVAFYVLIAVRAHFRSKGVFKKGPNLLAYLDLVALGTVADCVALDRNNRNMVANGLEVMRSGKARPGIQALIQIARRNPVWIESDDMGFSLAPRLNAAGRLEDMTIGVRCLLSDNRQDALAYATMLDEINQERRQLQSQMTQEALDYVLNMKHIPACAVVCQPTWHEGIIGLVASMIKERFHIPSIVLTQDENPEVMKGSCRSIPGLNIRDVLAEYDRQFPDSLVKFGGHAMAAGLSVKSKDVPQFTKEMITICKSQISEEMKNKLLLVDGALPTSHKTLSFAKQLIRSGPWGNGFEKPIFYNTFKLCDQYLVGGKHLKVLLEEDAQTYSGIMFNIEEGVWPNHHVTQVKVAYHLQVNEFNGKRTLQFLIVQMEPVSG
ncbi:MAG: single-stranded-DNA-specific exonuclease RecJ [Pseudomonadota bacterium]|nr:single-stranded-DNA-specific exonuclease RecJ [Pseudomonadota bacterium]